MKLQYVGISDKLPMMARTINRNTIIYIEADATDMYIYIYIYMDLKTW
jgi:hypothetical protein